MGIKKNIDLRPQDQKILSDLLRTHLPGVEVWAYGSRVKWTARPESDLDLVGFVEKKNLKRVPVLREAFEESTLPFRVDFFVWDEAPETFRGKIKDAYVVVQEAWRGWGGMSELPKTWKWLPFEKLLSIPLRNGIYKKKEFHGRGSKIVNMGELFKYPRLKDVDMKRVELTEKELKTSSLHSGDLIFARRSLTAEGAGKCSIVLEVNGPTTFESSIIRARLNKKIADPEFYYYLFNSQFGKWLLGTILRQVAVAGITGSDLAKLEVPVPPLNQQGNIAKHGALLDHKIELNRQINQCLEQIAQAIFKSWFVDFEPVKAKIEAKLKGQDPERAAMRAISGKSDEQLDQLSLEQIQPLSATAALFPDELEESELGLIPKGWEWSVVGDEVEVVGGGTPSTKKTEFWEGGNINWTSPKDLSGLQDKVLLNTEKRITEAGLEKISSGLLPVDTVLMSSRAPVGYLAQAKIPVAINQGYIAMKCNKRLPPEYILLWTDSVMDKIKLRASGSTFAEISKKNFRPIPVVVPDEHLLSEFIKHAKAIYDKITEFASESTSLSEIRNSLLPKLLSGEITLDTQNTAEDVA